jgi:hypothetical protein
VAGSCEDIGFVPQSLTIKSGRVARNREGVAAGGSIGANWLPYQVEFAFSLGVDSHPPSTRGKWELLYVLLTNIGLLQMLQSARFYISGRG